MVAEILISIPESDAVKASLERHYELVLAENGPAIRRLAASYTTTVSDRDDLFQDIAMAFWQALPAFRGEASERTFLFRVAHNRALAMLSRTRPPLIPVAEETELPDTLPDPEERFAREQQANRLVAATRRLPLPYRQVVTLALEGMEYSEIAEILGIEVSNVGVRLTRARKLLRQLLENSSER